MAAQKPGRTASGKPNAAAYSQTGTPNGPAGDRRKSYPVFDRQSAENALQAVGRAKSLTPTQIIDKVSRFANKTNDAQLKEKVAQARQTQRQKKNG